MQSPQHRAEQISFEVRSLMNEIQRHELRIKELQSEVRTLIEQVKAWL
jgi:chaperonin cofactor prefoldin